MTAKNSYPKPVYAVAGAGELAVQQIKKLPEAATKLRDKVQTELKNIDLTGVRERVTADVQQLRVKIADVRKKSVTEVRTDAEKFRLNAQDAVNELVETAQKQFQAASKQVVEVYEDLANRGAKVLGEDAPAPKTAPKSSAPKATKAVASKSTKPAASK